MSVALTRPDGVTEVFTSDDGEAAVTLWNLRAETAYSWVGRAEGRLWTGRFETEALPAQVFVGLEEVSGEPTWEHLAIPVACGVPAHVGVMDREGQLAWYQQITAGSELGPVIFTEGLRFTDEQTLVAVVGRRAIREFDMAGEVVFEAFFGDTYDKPVHHDAHREGEWTYVLNASVHEVDGISYIMDGFYVQDRHGTLVAEWSLRDHVIPSGAGLTGGFWASFFGGAVDFSHANGLWVSGEELLISFRALSTVIAVVADPLAPNFGDVLWVMDGDGDGRLGSDLALFSSVTEKVGFQDQHSPTTDEAGRLLLFDNRDAGQGPSRAIRLETEPQAGVAEITDSWDMDRHCLVQGSAYPMSNGHILATCAVDGTVMEFAPGKSEPVWSGRVVCQQEGILPGLLVRAQPVQFGFEGLSGG